jgi:hypothetical protein
LSRSAASSAMTDERASTLENRAMLLTLLMPSSSRTSPKSGSTSVMRSFSPCQAGAHADQLEDADDTGGGDVEDARAGGEEHRRLLQRLHEDFLHLLLSQLRGSDGG